MRRLYLLRHAKSSWELAGELDWERGLLPRGHDDSRLIGEYMLGAGIAPDFVICSSARRTKETLADVKPALPDGVQVLLTDDAYRASVSDLLELLRAAPEGAGSVMLVGHNPAIHDLAVLLAAGGDDLERMAAKFPTAALAEFEVTGSWRELDFDGAELTAFTRPKSLRL